MNKAFGSITNSVFYLSIQNQYYDNTKRWVSFGKTYQGTIFGLIAFTGKYTILFHIRNIWRSL